MALLPHEAYVKNVQSVWVQQLELDMIDVIEPSSNGKLPPV
jgi:hypothetical protein